MDNETVKITKLEMFTFGLMIFFLVGVAFLWVYQNNVSSIDSRSIEKYCTEVGIEQDVDMSDWLDWVEACIYYHQVVHDVNR